MAQITLDIPDEILEQLEKTGKKFNLVFVVFLLCKKNLCKKKNRLHQWSMGGRRRTTVEQKPNRKVDS